MLNAKLIDQLISIVAFKLLKERQVQSPSKYQKSGQTKGAAVMSITDSLIKEI